MDRPGAGRHECPACAAQRNGIAYEDWLDEHMLEMHDKIRRHGCTFTGVFGDGPSWVYSTGLLDTYGHPELTVVGLPMAESFALVNTWAALIRAGVHPKVGSAVDERGGFPARFIEVDARRCDPDTSQFADWHRYHDFIGCRTMPLRMLQLVYPDERGRFPGDDGYDPEHRLTQELLDQ